MIRFYYSPAPNPMKVALFLEEAGLAYKPIPVDTARGAQFEPAFVALNPNGKVPCIVDGDAVVFDSNAILLYLAEKTGRFLGGGTGPAQAGSAQAGSAQADPAQAGRRGALLSWLMFVATGIGPYSGQAVHFRHFAPEPREYAMTRYAFEAERHWGILEARLDGRRYVLGDEYSIVDMAVWGWVSRVPFVFGEPGIWTRLPNLKRLMDEIDARPAAQRARAMPDPGRFSKVDAAATRHMFRHIR